MKNNDEILNLITEQTKVIAVLKGIIETNHGLIKDLSDKIILNRESINNLNEGMDSTIGNITGIIKTLNTLSNIIETIQNDIK